MSNYPPGVTGSEPQIAGYDERERKLTCKAEDVDVYTSSSANFAGLRQSVDRLRALARDIEDLDLKHKIFVEAQRISYRISEMENVTMDECPFDDEVLWYGSRRTGDWHTLCPLCHTEHNAYIDEH